MFRVIKQHDIKDCGAACLSMICANYNLRLPLASFRELIQVDDEGANIYGIVNGAEKVGLIANALQGDREELIEGISNKEFLVPFIARVIIHNTLEHFVVVYKVSKKFFYVADPAEGKKKYSYNEFFAIWTGHIIAFEKSDTFEESDKIKGTFKRFIELITCQKKFLLCVLIISILITLISVLGAFVLQIIVDGIESNSTDFNQKNTLAIVCIAVIVLYFLQAGMAIIRGFCLTKLSMNIDMTLMMDYYNHVMDLPIKDINSRKTGDIISRFTDASNIRNALSGATFSLVLDTLMISVSIVILYTLNHSLFYLTLAFILIYSLVIIFFLNPTKKTNEKIMENNAEVISYLKESIDGMETIKSFGAEQETKEKTTQKLDKLLKSFFKGSMVYNVQDALANMIASIGVIILLWQGALLVMSNSISVGVLLTFYSLFRYFLESVKNLVGLQPEIQTAVVAAERLNDLLDLDIESGNENDIECDSSIKFVDVDFRYGYRELILRNINMSIGRGETIALVGESGSGKTTLTKLLMAFYYPEKGKIFIGNTDISLMNPKNVRKQIAYVSQDTFLFSDTIKNNLLIGNPHATMEEIEEACKLSKADEFINKLPLGYDTLLGENGLNLSGGQRQRLAIARAILKKPKILILDEATSNLDTITENSIKETIRSLRGNITSIIIAHRLSTVKNCDSIYVLDAGKIVENGTHEELIKKEGLYYRFSCENA